MPQAESNLSIQDLRAIIHSLKLMGLSFIETEAVDDIEFMIKNLPSAEALTKMVRNPELLKQVSVQVGEIMQTIEAYSVQTSESTARFKSKKGLPPRYKGLEWRDMGNMEKAANSNMITSIIKLSSELDNLGENNIANKLTSCAKKVINNKSTIAEIITTIVTLSSEADNNGLNNISEKLIICAQDLQKEAGWMDNIRDGFGAIKDTVQQGTDAIKHNYQGRADTRQKGIEAQYMQQMTTGLTNAINAFEESMDTNVLLQETQKLTDWSNQVDNMLDANTKQIAQNIEAFIQELNTQANDMNNDMVNQADFFMKTVRSEIQQLIANSTTNHEIDETATDEIKVTNETPVGTKVKWMNKNNQPTTGEIVQQLENGNVQISTGTGGPFAIGLDRLTLANNDKYIKIANNALNSLIVTQIL